ncbi:assimilatory nitrate reductase catalytic subunit NasC [Bacillus sp. JJ1764]|uniref:assimilatory nitrate reductase catalytic subunit NasC n=1 Tax=Bacillus sp. JJ1764 TaxID=3122964 RepID=UPI00300010A6
MDQQNSVLVEHENTHEVVTEQTFHTQCPFCSMQCKLKLVEQSSGAETKNKVTGQKNPCSEGRMCIKGMYAHQHVFSKERLKYPLLKVNGEFVRISWEDALCQIKQHFTDIQKVDGNHGIAVYGSASLTNEEAYLLGKFARVALKTKYIDYNGRYCMSAAATAAKLTFGIDRGFTNSLDEIPFAECIILAGTNLAECQPTIMPYFIKAQKNGASIIVIDPRETPTTKMADLHIKLKPGTDAALANGLLKVILEEGFVDEGFIKNRVNGFDEVKEYISAIEMREIEKMTGVAGEEIRKAALIFGKAKTGMILTARGVEQQTDGTMGVCGYLNILLSTGKIGKPFCGFGAITGQSNGQGAREHGQKADQLPGYRSIENEEHRRYIADVWGIDKDELPGKGVSAFEIFERIDAGEITGLFLMCSNPIVSSPNAQFVTEAIKKLRFFVAVDLFISETARMADLILPSSSYLEDEGTLTNLEGRVTLREATYPCPEEVKHDWEIICEIARALGKGEYFPFSSPEEIFNELRVASRGGQSDYYGITYDRIRTTGGILWPCPDLVHAGTKRLFETRFAHEDGRAKMIIVPNHQNVPKEQPNFEYPIFLTTGRVLAHYLTGVQTRKSPSLVARNGEAFMEIHPETAMKYNLPDKALVKISSKNGSIIVRSRYTNGIRKDTVFVPFHWADTQNVNLLVSSELDPFCKMPGFKMTAVNVRPPVGNTSI